MDYSCEVLAHTFNPFTKTTLLTYLVSFPRYVLAEFNTHKSLTRNTASSRAIPVKKRVEWVRESPFIPPFGKNQPGMVDAGPLDAQTNIEVERIWLEASLDAAKHASRLAEREVHKQFANRIVEPYSWVNVITSGTDWANFFHLRCSEAAAPEIRTISELMYEKWHEQQHLYKKAHSPDVWHLPLVTEEDAMYYYHAVDPETIDVNTWLARVSAGRCARVSYDKQTEEESIDKTLQRFDNLVAQGHWSPLEHQARPMLELVRSGCFNGFEQFRKMFKGECIREFRDWKDIR